MQGVSLFRRVSVLTAVFAYLQIALGGVVRVSGSGLGCPDWPTCHGGVVPPNRHATIEESHRIVASLVGWSLDVRRQWRHHDHAAEAGAAHGGAHRRTGP